MIPTKAKPEYFALLIFVAAPLFFGMGQEISASLTPHDDSYFITRSVDFGLNGDYHAGIKEILYPFFIRISSFFGLGLRNFEELCYGIALFCLWLELTALTNSRIIAWGSVLPLAFFCYQHPVFDRSTYDALQLILLPLSFSSSIRLYRKEANWRSVIWAGIVVGLHVLTRPEGFLFILPPVISLIFVWYQSRKRGERLSDIKVFLIKFFSILLILFLSQQIASYVNWTTCGFWAPTLIKSSSFQRCLKALMSIEPQKFDNTQFAPVPNSSLEKAYQVSPAFRKTEPYFDKNIDGRGWSENGFRHSRPRDGSINALFRWALLDAGAYVAGGKTGVMLKYFDLVADELQKGFDSGGIKKRRVVSTAIPSVYSVFDSFFWSYLCKVGSMFLNLTNPPLPQIAEIGESRDISLIYNKVALRRTSLLRFYECLLTGWVVNPAKGIPLKIALDRQAAESGIKLKVTERPDVAKEVFGFKENKKINPLCGIVIKSFGHAAGHLIVMDGSATVALSLNNLTHWTSGENYREQGVLLHVDTIKRMSNPGSSPLIISPLIFSITKSVYYAARIGIFLSFLLIFILFFYKPLVFRTLDFAPVYLVFFLMSSVALPRLVLLATYGGVDDRYIAVGVLSIWVFGFFCISFFVYNLIRILTAKFIIRKCP